MADVKWEIYDLLASPALKRAEAYLVPKLVQILAFSPIQRDLSRIYNASLD